MLTNPHNRVAAMCAGGVLAMLCAAYAAVPLYKLYCQVTGSGGTTQRAEKPSDVVLDRKITVRFDANVSKDMPWTFEPVQRTMVVKIGDTALAFYKATNTSDQAVKGTAMFNVSPDVAGVHFNKIECFCFKEQTLQPGQSVEMPVSFFLDPKMVEDRDTAGLQNVTLSYVFYPSERTAAAPGQAGGG